MGRPKRVYPSTLSLYDKFHTRLVTMMSGTKITALHLVKETEQFFWALESWAFCCGHFKAKKKNFQLQFNLPVLKDEKAKKFLKEHAWHDWVKKEYKAKDTDMIESVEFLNRLFPNKKKVFFLEIKSLVSGFCHGSFVRYDRDGNEEKPREHDLKKRNYYSSKYSGYTVIAKRDLTPVFRAIGEHVVVVPYVFTKCCVEGSSYENAGEIYMVITDDTVYFETERHF